MKRLILMLLVIASLQGFSQCPKKCWLFIPKQFNEKNSPTFDSSYVRTRLIALFWYKQDYINYTLIHDTSDYINLVIKQKITLSQIIPFTVHEGQELNITFWDSSPMYKIIIPMNVVNTRLGEDYRESNFTLPLTDSLKSLLLTRPIKGLWVSNQKSVPKIADKLFKSFYNKDQSIAHFDAVFCCFEEQKGNPRKHIYRVDSANMNDPHFLNDSIAQAWNGGPKAPKTPKQKRDKVAGGFIIGLRLAAVASLGALIVVAILSLFNA